MALFPLMAVQRVSQKDIAARAGVHVTTVSLALRNSPRLPQKTRERIHNLAKEMGYQPDPMLSALTVYRRHAQQPHYQGTLAWLNNTRNASNAAIQANSFIEYRAGAEQRCFELGYTLEEFQTSDTPLPRLSKILQTRNISGILLPPQPRQLSHITFDWEHFSAISFGFSLAHPRLHLVTNAQYRSARIATRKMRSLGYRRIGYTTLRNAETRTDLNFSSGYLAELRFGNRDLLPIFEFDDMQKSGRRTFQKAFEKWYRSNKPDAILSLDNEIPKALKKMGIGTDICGYAGLYLKNESQGVAGINQNDFLIGRTAVDFLVDMFHRNERGIPSVPLRILVEGTWVDGSSLPTRQPRIE